MYKLEQQVETERPLSILKRYLMTIASDTNASLEQAWDIDVFLSKAALIDMDGYADDKIFGSADVAIDREEVYKRAIKASSADNPNVQAFYAEKYGLTSPFEIVAFHKEQKEKNKSGQVEMLITLLFHKAFGDNFFVARASEYDDYVNGIDTVLINKETGEVVCAFDEVHDHVRSDRSEKKIKKITSIAQRGGTTLKYGLAKEDGKFTRKSIKNLPVFCVSLKTEELLTALDELGDTEFSLTGNERGLIEHLISDMLKQSDMLKPQSENEQFLNNLDRAQHQLWLMQEQLKNQGQ